MMLRFAVAGLATLAALASCDGALDPSDPGNLVPRTVDEDPTLPSVSLNGTKLHLETFGDPDAPVIVFLHGGPGSDYRAKLRLKERYGGISLADDHFLVFWDQRGSGLSRRHDCGVYTLDLLDADLDAVIDAFSPGRPVILVGTSWGGMYATEYVNRHPDKVAGAVLIDSGPLNGQLYESVAGEIFETNVLTEVLSDVLWESQVLTPDDHARADFAQLIGMRDGQPNYHLDMEHDPAPLWRLGAVANRCIQQLGVEDGEIVYDFTDHLAAYTTPVRFIAGENDEVLGPAFQEKQRAHYPVSDLVTVPDAGHDVAWTHAAEVVAAIRSYLEEVE